jgi:peptidoglycan/LPS O-acetylase OafA/YrhL
MLAPVAQYGFLGVPVFFAISGFVIAYSAEGRTPVGFAIARFSRIYPTFVLCMTLTFAVTVVFGAGHFEVTPAQWLANLFIAAPLVGQPYVDTPAPLCSARSYSPTPSGVCSNARRIAPPR